MYFLLRIKPIELEKQISKSLLIHVILYKDDFYIHMDKLCDFLGYHGSSRFKYGKHLFDIKELNEFPVDILNFDKKTKFISECGATYLVNNCQREFSFKMVFIRDLVLQLERIREDHLTFCERKYTDIINELELEKLRLQEELLCIEN